MARVFFLNSDLRRRGKNSIKLKNCQEKYIFAESIANEDFVHVMVLKTTIVTCKVSSPLVEAGPGGSCRGAAGPSWKPKTKTYR